MVASQISIFKRFLVSAALTLALVLLASCGNGTARFTVEAKANLTFTPDTITVKPGQTVELTLVNNGKLPHTFTAPDLNIEIQMPPGETSSITLTLPTQAGEYPFFSALTSEFDTMKGKIVVQTER